MKHFGSMAATAATLSFLALLSSPSVLAQGADPSGGDVDAGRYVATVAGCGACHNGTNGQEFAGGHALRTPFGPLAAPNITPDEATGIGGWTLQDFRSALHRGIGKDGKLLYPAMPYLHYTEMTDEDVENLWAYVRSVPAVSNEVDVNRLRFPFDIRQSLRVWRARYFEAGRFAPNPDKSEAWNRGAYIVDALAHCGACHTPRDALGGPIEARRFEGARIEEWYAPDISGGSGSVIADWSAERLREFLTGGSPDHVAVGSMSLVVTDLESLTADDVTALVTYLQDQPAPAEAPRAPSPAVTVTADMKARAESLFEGECVQCHGASGEGEPGIAASLVGAGGVVAAEPTNVISVLLEGIEPRGDYGIMPSYRTQLSDADIAALANHVRTSWGNAAPPNATPEIVGGLRAVTRTAPGLRAAAVCPSTPADRLDDTLRQSLADLATQSAPSKDAVSAIVARYRDRNPDATTTEAITDLGGVYCRAVAASGVGRAQTVHRELAFMNEVIAVETASR